MNITIPIPFTKIPEMRFGPNAFRWATRFDAWWRSKNESFGSKFGVSIGIVLQHLFHDEWSSYGGNFVDVSLTSSFIVGVEHFWYDHPNCCYSLGFLHIITTGNPFDGWGCERCRNER